MESSSREEEAKAAAAAEQQQQQQLQTLESDLSANPSNFDTHVKYIKLLREMGETEKLREARERLNVYFALSPAMWMEWAKDEEQASASASLSDLVVRVYERGISEYYASVSLWLDYLKYVQQHDPNVFQLSPDGISKARELFERAVTATCLHISHGALIWDAYIQFEQTILQTIDHSDIQAKEAQVQRIRSLFHRHLSLPYPNLRSVLDAYQAWELNQGNIALHTRSPEALRQSRRAEVLRQYLLSCSPPGSYRSRCASFFYLNHLDGVPTDVLEAYKKAERMYQQRYRLEQDIISSQDLSESMRAKSFMTYSNVEFAILCGNSRIPAKLDRLPDRLKMSFERAITELPFSDIPWSCYIQYHQKYVKATEYAAMKDLCYRATRHCPSVGEFWVQYLLCLERGHASEKEISSVFDRSRKYTFSTPEEHLDLFLTRVDGLRRRISSATGDDVLNYSLIRETFKQAADYLTPQMKDTDGLLRLHAYWARLELTLGDGLVAARDVWENLLKTCGSMLEAWQGYITMEIELGHINEARAIYKRCYNNAFSKNGSEDICHSWLCFERVFGTLENLEHAVQKVQKRLWALKRAQAKAAVLEQEYEFNDEETDQQEQTLEKTACRKRKSHSSATYEPSPAKRQKNALYKDQYTAFLSNLDLKAKDEDLLRFFSGITSIRIVHDKFTGESRGLAYVDFVDDEHLAAAVVKNEKMLFGKKLSIQRSSPRQAEKESFGRRAPGGHEDASKQSGIAGSTVSEDPVEISEGSLAPQMPQASARQGVDNIQLNEKPKSNDSVQQTVNET